MKVQEYRDLISEVADLWASARSAASGDNHAAERERLRLAHQRLREAECPRASNRDRMRALALLARVNEFLSFPEIWDRARARSASTDEGVVEMSSGLSAAKDDPSQIGVREEGDFLGCMPH